MLKYMDLCVQLQQHRQAKDGLHQYRNMAQQQAPGSLEVPLFILRPIRSLLFLEALEPSFTNASRPLAGLNLSRTAALQT